MQAGARCAPTKGAPPHRTGRGEEHHIHAHAMQKVESVKMLTYAGRGGRAGKTNSRVL